MVRKISLVLGCAARGGRGIRSGRSDCVLRYRSPDRDHRARARDAHDKVVDVGKKGDSTGDIFTYHSDLYDETDTTKVGGDNGMCVRESPKAGTWECWWTTTLADGMIGG